MVTRTLLLLLLGVALFSRTMTHDVIRDRQIDLNAPSAMENLRATNPKHYETIRKIVAGLDQDRSRSVPKWIQTTFGAKDVSYPAVLWVSLPPQRFLSFSLDDTQYLAMVTLEPWHPEIYPTKHR